MSRTKLTSTDVYNLPRIARFPGYKRYTGRTRTWKPVEREHSDSHSVQEPTRDNSVLRDRKTEEEFSSSSASSSGPSGVENNSSPNNISQNSNESNLNNDVAIEQTPDGSSSQQIDKTRRKQMLLQAEYENEIQDIESKYAATKERISAEYEAEMRKYEAEMRKYKAEIKKIRNKCAARIERINAKGKAIRRRLRLEMKNCDLDPIPVESIADVD